MDLGVGTCSPAVLAFSRKAIANSTRRSYETAVRKYQAFAEIRNWGTLAIGLTAARAAEFVAHLGADGRLKPGTIDAYCTALSTWFVELLSDQPNPMASEALSRVKEGVKRHLSTIAREEVKTDAKALPPTALTHALLERLAPVWRSDSAAEAKRMLAVCYLGVCCLLRPNEIFGSPKAPDRVPLAASVVFYRRDGSLMPVGRSSLPADTPDRFSIDLGVTKSDQHGKRKPKVCSVPAAVSALWKWSIIRYNLGGARPELFALDGAVVSQRRVLSELIAAHKAQGLGVARFTGKSFRRGGTSGLVARGLPIADVRAAAGWRSDAMVGVYTIEEAAQQRLLSVGRSL